MKMITDLDFQLNNTAVCIGKFDGLHRGHRMLIHEAENSGLTMVMITFVFEKGKSIYSYEEKKILSEELGVDVMIAIPVTEEFIHMTPEAFIEDILVKKCDARKVAVGADFGFGYQRAGNARMLQESGKQYGFAVAVFEKLTQDGEVISSTRIRMLLAEGRVREANLLLETPYFIHGIVEEGNHIGRQMSTPTANIRPAAGKELPPFGVYAVRVKMEDKLYEGISNLGVKPTIPGENPVGLEVWLFDYEGNLYGKKLTVFLIEFQRPERKFASVEELKKQIAEDTIRAKEILAQRES